MSTLFCLFFFFLFNVLKLIHLLVLRLMALKPFSFLVSENLSTAYSHSDENSVVDVSVLHFSLSLPDFIS